MLKFSFKQQVFAGFTVAVILVLVVGILSFRSIHKLESDSNLVDHTQKVIKTSTHLLQLMIDAETAMRGFAATNNPVFLDPYNAALPVIKVELEKLRDLEPDNPEQVQRVDSLSKLIEQQLIILKTDIEIRPIKGLDYMVQNHMILNGKHNMDRIREINDQIIGTENKLLATRRATSEEASNNVLVIIIGGSAVFLIIIIVLFIYIDEAFQQQKRIEQQIKIANAELETVLEENKAKNWLLTGSGLLNKRMQGQQSERELAGNILDEICSYTKALTGTLYLYNEYEDNLILHASYAFNDLQILKQTIKVGEGWIGQVAINKNPAVIKGKLNDRLELGSSLVLENLVESFIIPFFFDNKLMGVIEIAFNQNLKGAVQEFILVIADAVGIAVNTAQARTVMHDLLLQVQQQTEELEAQQEEMRITNEELLSKTEMLQASEEELIVQQEELRSTNTELEEKASLLEEKNQAIEEARNAINIQVQQLEATGKYKSEFLANMSHELRTPLNSILILARILQDNKPANLSEDQIKYASVIFNAGTDLLTLINDILDLSKIESGKMELQNETIKIADVLHDMEMLFAEMAHNKKITYTINTSEELAKDIFTDKMKVEQVLKNLLSNAFKFTPENGVITISATAGSIDKTVNFSIKDSGIGIPADKQKIIFEAFQQADGSTSRKYGGTGLGLSISRELVKLLGGEIALKSEPGNGSEFILTLPLTATDVVLKEESIPTIENFAKAPSFLKPVEELPEGSDKEPLVLIVEDDKNFADILEQYAKDHGYRSILINDGTNAVEQIKENQPNAVILDIMLPGKDGWQILKELKQDESTLHIPVHLMSAGDVAANRVNREGAIGFLKKPVDTGLLDKLFNDMMLQSGARFTQVLLIEDNKTQNQALYELMKNQGITVDQAYDGASALRKLYEKEYQCVILDLNLPDMSGLDFLDKIKATDRFKALPVIVNTAMEMDKTTVSRLMQYANAMVVKNNKSSNRLIDEVNLFLNKIIKTADQPKIYQKAFSNRKNVLSRKKILIVDDDLRNIFALSSALQGHEMLIETANDGIEAINKLESINDIDLALMDIMMPKMDGYEAIRYIRKQNKWKKFPVIALTAKAMKDDKEKCIAAGANDYITKPVDMDRLISLMQLWLGT